LLNNPERPPCQQPRKLNEAIGEIDRALEALYLHSHFNEIAFVLFRRMAEGDLSLAEQQMLKTLGIKL
jgi:transcription initiation factor TFIIIB Brf1 subunit/transcription initiation factor TFIIB